MVNALLRERERPSDNSYTEEFYRPVAPLATAAWDQDTFATIFVFLAGRPIKLSLPGSKVPSWLPSAILDLEALRRLKRNWDSYGALPVDGGAIVSAFGVLVRAMPQAKAKLPSFLATPDGGVKLTWHDGVRELDVTVHQGDRASFYYYDPKSGVEIDDQPVISRGSELTEYIAQFA